MPPLKDHLSLQLQDISKSFATHTLFEGLSLQIGAKSRIGLIGKNGCGKSTLLKIIMGELEPNEGTITRAPGLRINYLTQEPKITPGLTLEQEMQSVFDELNDLTAKEAEIIEEYNQEGLTEDDYMVLAEKLDAVHQEMARLDAGSMDARIGKILKGLGFEQADHQRQTTDFSGGWQMRVNLAKILLEDTDVLLMDEPTNHLDMDACEWLEGFLNEYPGGIVLVSHDRRFLDQVTTHIADLEGGKIRVWTGNYTSHLAQKAAEIEALSSAYDRQQKEIEKQTTFVDRFRASANRATQAKSRERQLEKMERIEMPVTDNKRMSIRFPTPPSSGKDVLSLRQVAKTFDEKTLFDGLEADLERGQRVFLLGGNGTGKTTLLRLITGLEKPDILEGGKPGVIESGHNVELGYFSQNQLDTLSPDLSPFDTLREACPTFTDTEVRTVLGRFLFSGDQVFKPIKVLSGGEKSKVALAKLMMSGSNFLLLDEPTNHMDIASKEVMTEALKDYEGSMLCISHDRYFIQTLATHIWELYEGQLLVYAGGYDYYRFKRDDMREKALARKAKLNAKSAPAPKKVSEPSVKVKPDADRKALEKKLKQAEKKIETLEAEIKDLETEMANPAAQQDYVKLQKDADTLTEKQTALHTLNQDWEDLTEQLSSLV